MTRPTHIEIDADALEHNVLHVKALAPHQRIIAMVKANAYGCGIASVVPVLSSHVDAFGVACLEEAMAVKKLTDRPCILFQGVFNPEELIRVSLERFHCVLHQPQQIDWLLNHSLPFPIKVWVKLDTGMHRLGFSPAEVLPILERLSGCPWVDDEVGLMTHLASADELENQQTDHQLMLFNDMTGHLSLRKSMANSAAILSRADTHADVVRPGLMLYGVSPFAKTTASSFNLKPVMSFLSAITAIHEIDADELVGYGGIWKSQRPSRLGVVACGYGDGYPRHIQPNTPVWIKHHLVPVVGRVSMDMMTVDLSDVPDIAVGDEVELWGANLPVETIAAHAGTVAYELLCQVSPRARDRDVLSY